MHAALNDSQPAEGQHRQYRRGEVVEILRKLLYNGEYPKTEQVRSESIEFREACDDGVTVRVRFVDLFDIQNSLESIKSEILCETVDLK